MLLEAAALDGARPVAKGETVRMAPVLKGLRLPVTGLGDVKQCQVHRGGVSVRAVDDRTCEVRRVQGSTLSASAGRGCVCGASTCIGLGPRGCSPAGRQLKGYAHDSGFQCSGFS